MSRTVIADVDGWTPVIDDLIKEVGLMTATVFGVVWRRCQMEDGYCWAAQDNLGKTLGLSRQAISDHIKKLVAWGYLDEVGYGANGVKKLFDTGKAGLKISLTASNRLSGSDTTRCKVQTQPDVTLPDTKKVIKKDIKKVESNISTNVDIPEPVYEEFNNQADMPQSFVDEYKPVKPPKKSKSDPRYLHIAYSAFYSVTSRRPNRELVDTIIELIGDSPDTEKLRACYKEWLMRGYNQNSIKWLEWYRDGIPGIKRNEVKSFRPTEENDPYFDVVHR